MPALMWQWLKTRMLLKKILVLWGLVVLSCLIAQPAIFAHLPTALSVLGMSGLLIAVFRLWDDLADRAFDRQRVDASGRVLVQLDVVAAWSFYGCVGVMLVASVLLFYLLYGYMVAVGLLVLIVFMAAVYHWLPALTTPRSLRTVLVLLKYPAMLMLLTGGQVNLKTGSSALFLYALLLAYEWYESLKKNI